MSSYNNNRLNDVLLFELARQRVPAPTERRSRLRLRALGVLERRFDRHLLGLLDRAHADLALATRQLILRPGAERDAPVAAGNP